MLVRNYDETLDYKDLCDWWVAQDCPEVPKSMLGQGFIIEDDKEKLACVFVYTTPSSIFIMEGLVGNPASDKEKRSEGIKQVIDHGCNWAKNNGAQTVIATVGKKRIMDNLISLEFKKVQDNLSTFVRSL